MLALLKRIIQLLEKIVELLSEPPPEDRRGVAWKVGTPRKREC